MYIRHFSTLRDELLEEALGLVVAYIWEKAPCDHVRVEINHIKDAESGKMAAEPAFKAAYAKFGFRWKTLTNDPETGRRAQIM